MGKIDSNISGRDTLWYIGKNNWFAVIIVLCITHPRNNFELVIGILLLGLLFTANEINEERLSLRIKNLENQLKQR